MLPNFLGDLKDYIKLSTKKLSELCKGLVCPYCDCDEVIQWGYYSRNVKTLHEKIRIIVKRMLCNNPECKRTFSLLPCFLLPYQQYSLSVLEDVCKAVMLDNLTPTKAFIRISIEKNTAFVPGSDTFYRMWSKIYAISKRSGDNIYSFGKQFEPDIDPFSNPVYQDILGRKGRSAKWIKLGLQWITAKTISCLCSLKRGGSATPLCILHYCSSYPRLFLDSS